MPVCHRPRRGRKNSRSPERSRGGATAAPTRDCAWVVRGSDVANTSRYTVCTKPEQSMPRREVPPHTYGTPSHDATADRRACVTEWAAHDTGASRDGRSSGDRRDDTQPVSSKLASRMAGHKVRGDTGMGWRKRPFVRRYASEAAWWTNAEVDTSVARAFRSYPCGADGAKPSEHTGAMPQNGAQTSPALEGFRCRTSAVAILREIHEVAGRSPCANQLFRRETSNALQYNVHITTRFKTNRTSRHV